VKVCRFGVSRKRFLVNGRLTFRPRWSAQNGKVAGRQLFDLPALALLAPDRFRPIRLGLRCRQAGEGAWGANACLFRQNQRFLLEAPSEVRGGGPNSARLEFTLTSPRNTEDPVTGVTKVRLGLDQDWSWIVRGEAQSVGIAGPRLATGAATLSPRVCGTGRCRRGSRPRSAPNCLNSPKHAV
jgi:hypothetical protein